MFCGYCGKTINDDFAFCPYCGKRTVTSSDPSSSDEGLGELDAIFKDAVAEKRRAETERRTKLERAKELCRLGFLDEAYEVYISLDETDVARHIGVLRVVSVNFSRFNGGHLLPRKCYSDSMVYGHITYVRDVVLAAKPSNDPDYDDYMRRYGEWLEEVERTFYRDCDEAGKAYYAGNIEYSLKLYDIAFEYNYKMETHTAFPALSDDAMLIIADMASRFEYNQWYRFGALGRFQNMLAGLALTNPSLLEKICGVLKRGGKCEWYLREGLPQRINEEKNRRRT